MNYFVASKDEKCETIIHGIIMFTSISRAISIYDELLNTRFGNEVCRHAIAGDCIYVAVQLLITDELWPHSFTLSLLTGLLDLLHRDEKSVFPLRDEGDFRRRGETFNFISPENFVTFNIDDKRWKKCKEAVKPMTD
uniref:Uncharacterized protein n=1 Tax=Glossina palpalis gambiensis TaxID=67801 RepID=A0A1B0BT45_9MUSC